MYGYQGGRGVACDNWEIGLKKIKGGRDKEIPQESCQAAGITYTQGALVN